MVVSTLKHIAQNSNLRQKRFYNNGLWGQSCLILSGAPHEGRLLALPANIRLGWKGLPGINTLAYYKNLQITAAKVL
jgi:hypothetical protein